MLETVNAVEAINASNSSGGTAITCGSRGTDCPSEKSGATAGICTDDVHS